MKMEGRGIIFHRSLDSVHLSFRKMCHLGGGLPPSSFILSFVAFCTTCASANIWKPKHFHNCSQKLLGTVVAQRAVSTPSVRPMPLKAPLPPELVEPKPEVCCLALLRPYFLTFSFQSVNNPQSRFNPGLTSRRM